MDSHRIGHILIQTGTQQPLKIVPRYLIKQLPFVLAEGHPGDTDGAVGDLDHLIYSIVTLPTGQELVVDPPEDGFEHQDVPEGIVGGGSYVKAQIVAQVLKVVLGNDAVAVKVAGQLERADHLPGLEIFPAEHLHIEPGVVGHHHAAPILEQLAEVLVHLASPEGGFVPYHLVGDVVDGHGLDRNGHPGIKQFADRGAGFRFECNLAEPVVGSRAGGFCVKEDEHGCLSHGPLTLRAAHQKKWVFPWPRSIQRDNSFL
jgi:hypothetical protein